MAELEPLLPYDPSAMRELAAGLQRQAQGLGGAGAGVAAASSSMTFDGPAGDRIRSRLAAVSGTLDASASRLQDTAGRLAAAAEQVEAENAAIERHNAAVLASLPPLERRLVLENT